MLWFIKGHRKHIRRPGLTFMLAAALCLAVLCGDGSAAVKKSGQEVFSSPEEAAGAFIQAIRNKDTGKLRAILGPSGRDLISSGDDVADAEAGNRVVKMYEEKNQIAKTKDGKAILELGNGNWPLPLPIVEKKGKWLFDTKAGREEILNRGIGRNELGTIQVCRSYVVAQREYAAQPHDASGLLAYAQKFLSEEGKQDGLYWQTKPGEPESPMGIFMVAAYKEGYRKGEKQSPYHGYFYKILKAQGKHAPGGAYDYVANGRMIGGFAIIAYPAKYGVSGIMTFIVNQDGEVYEKNLGPKTDAVARAMKLYDPDKSWKKVK